MRRLSTAAAGLTAVALLPAGAHAQLEGPYRLQPGDTIALREVTRSVVHIQTPQGEIVAQSDHDATVAMTLVSGSDVEAWYEALSLVSDGPNGEVRPSTEGVLGEPYRLTMSPSGALETRSAPEPSAEISAITDLTQQFFDFFVTLPDARPEVGTSWQDTLHTTASGIPETTQEVRTLRRYVVRGDTLVDGVAALVLDVTTEVSIEASSPMEGQALTVTTVLTGGETGVVLFDSEAGRMLVREREGELSGVFRINAPQPLEFPQSMSFSSRISSVR